MGADVYEVVMDGILTLSSRETHPAPSHFMKPEQQEDDTSVIGIDEHHLDRECVKLPTQYHQVAYQAAETARDIDELKAELKVAEAEIRLKVRSSPEKFGLEKVTEGVLDEIATLNPKVMELGKKIRRKEAEAAMCKAMVSTLEVKKRSLTNLVELHSAGYHAEVRPSKAGREGLDRLSRERISRPIKRTPEERRNAIDDD